MWGIGIDEIIKRNWKYGFVFIGQYVSEKTINYVVKYMLKSDGQVIYENESVQTQSNYLSIEFQEPLKLPLNIGGKKQNYFVIWERLGEVQPRDIKVSCGC